ncbi:hypothetical protein, partial [Candidatus Hakubella thermalkaliphila]|uniref:hypothetical protein n=1 Tax=Candidatus Hakubella thermalkaliphila TaxID=2754717 RepID=UPI001594513A
MDGHGHRHDAGGCLKNIHGYAMLFEIVAVGRSSRPQIFCFRSLLVSCPQRFLLEKLWQRNCPCAAPRRMKIVLFSRESPMRRGAPRRMKIAHHV